MNRYLSSSLIVAAAILPMGASTLGQRTDIGQGLRDHNPNAPIDIGSDRAELDDLHNRAYAIGNVDVRQGRLRLRADRVTVAYSGRSSQVQRIDATGGVVITSPSETIRGRVAIYDFEAEIITLVGDVSLENSNGRLAGGRLIYNLETGRAVMDGGEAGAPGSRAPTTGRVTGRFTVQQTKEN